MVWNRTCVHFRFNEIFYEPLFEFAILKQKKMSFPILLTFSRQKRMKFYWTQNETRKKSTVKQTGRLQMVNF